MDCFSEEDMSGLFVFHPPLDWRLVVVNEHVHRCVRRSFLARLGKWLADNT